jgi:predicted RNA-binding protein with PUA-like domain
MTLGDKAFFYHSSAGKETGIVGEVEVEYIVRLILSLKCPLDCS